MGDDQPQIITPPNPIKAKVDITPNGVDLEALERAEQVISNLQGSYLEWVQDDLRNLGQAYADAAAASGQARKELCEKVFSIAHDIKGQGGSFNYPLMTVIGNYLCRFLEKNLNEIPTDQDMQLVKLHVDALGLVISEKMTGDGGPSGERLVKGLEAVLAKKANMGA